jgi:hypothetical protein
VAELAKVVSDAALGGQILLEGATFSEVKDRLAELGAVDEDGINYKRLSWKVKAGALAALCAHRWGAAAWQWGGGR